MFDKVACPKCGEKYKSLGRHWAHNTNHRPEFTQHQKEIITGLLMGDGSITACNKNPHIECSMITPNYLEYIDDIFGCLGSGVSLKQTAEKNADRKRNSGFRPNAKAEDYSDVYRWRSRSHPDLQKWVKWYKTGKKVWPEDIELTPTVLKHWYCGDGYWNNKGYNNRISISMANEIDNLEKVNNIFKNVELPAPSNYDISEREGGGKRCNAQWTVDQSKELWKYMGEPLPDFYYKWPEQYQ